MPAGVAALEIEFQSLSPTAADQGRVAMTTELMSVQWSRLLLYPAGYDARRIRFQPSLRLPAGWQFGSALEKAGADGDTIRFQPLALVDLVDSPVYAGRYFKRFDLDPGAKIPVHLDVVADAPELLEAKPQILEAHRALVKQADRVFGTRPFAHYDFLLALSDQFSGIGLEHHQSSENGTFPGYLTGDAPFSDNYLLPHEYTHSWNGKFMRPATLWTPHYNTPMQNDLLWVYEGQTEYWAWVLAARAGLVHAATGARSAGRHRGDVRASRRPRLAQPAGHRLPGHRRLQRRAAGVGKLAARLRFLRRRHPGLAGRGHASWANCRRASVRSTTSRVASSAVTRARLEARRYGFDDVVKALDRRAGARLGRLPARAHRQPRAGCAAGRAGARRLEAGLYRNPEPGDRRCRGRWRIRRLPFFAGPAASPAKQGKVNEVLWEGPAYRAGLAKDMQVVAVNRAWPTTPSA